VLRDGWQSRIPTGGQSVRDARVSLTAATAVGEIHLPQLPDVLRTGGWTSLKEAEVSSSVVPEFFWFFRDVGAFVPRSQANLCFVVCAVRRCSVAVLRSVWQATLAVH